MSTLIVATILVALVIGICLVLLAIDKKEKKKDRDLLLRQFSALGSMQDMRFSSQEILKNCVIGVDGVRRKLLVLQGLNEDEFQTSIIHLAEVNRCAVKKHFEVVHGRGTKVEKMENYLERIVLQFELKDGKVIEIPFYTHLENYIAEHVKLEQKARHWESMLSKLIDTPTRKIA